MMARVSLGDSERRLIPPRMTVLAFALLNVSALLRVVVTVFSISNYGSLILLSGSLWIFTFCFSSVIISQYSLLQELTDVRVKNP